VNRWTLPLVVVAVVLVFTFPKFFLVAALLWIAAAVLVVAFFVIGYLYGFTIQTLRSRRIDREIRDLLESDRG
jgi:hypothetical protein